jgi:hypothetical protein
MVYIAIICITAGVFIFIYSLVAENPPRESLDGSEEPVRLRVRDEEPVPPGSGESILPARRYSREEEGLHPLDREPAGLEEVPVYDGDFLDLSEEMDEFAETDEAGRMVQQSPERERREPARARQAYIWEEEESFGERDPGLEAPALDLGETEDDLPGFDEFPSPAEPEENRILLYEDSTGLIDYHSSSSMIAADPAVYASLKRKGEGTLEADPHGIVFRANGTFFRFDYRRITDIRTGEDYTAIFMSGGGPVWLLIFSPSSGAGETVQQGFAGYLKGA